MALTGVRAGPEYLETSTTPYFLIKTKAKSLYSKFLLPYFFPNDTEGQQNQELISSSGAKLFLILMSG